MSKPSLHITLYYYLILTISIVSFILIAEYSFRDHADDLENEKEICFSNKNASPGFSKFFKLFFEVEKENNEGYSLSKFSIHEKCSRYFSQISFSKIKKNNIQKNYFSNCCITQIDLPPPGFIFVSTSKQ